MLVLLWSTCIVTMIVIVNAYASGGDGDSTVCSITSDPVLVPASYVLCCVCVIGWSSFVDVLLL